MGSHTKDKKDKKSKKVAEAAVEEEEKKEEMVAEQPAGETSAEESTKASDPSPGGEEKTKKAKKPRSEYSVWVGNLPFSVTREDLEEFFKPCGGNITRINLPKKNNKIKGFAYVDFDTESAMTLAMAHSEQKIGRRAVLIKSASDFVKTGRPSRIDPKAAEEEEKDGGSEKKTKDKTKEKKMKKQKHDPSPTLFMGNLSYDVKKADLKTMFEQFGAIVGIRVATFEDNREKCKGFGYVDFKYTDDATKALMAMNGKKLKGRMMRIEYAGATATEKGRPWEKDLKKRTHDESGAPMEMATAEPDLKKARKMDTENTDNIAETKLMGVAVQFEGSKITFGE
ncbi:Nucleolar protein 13 [Linderina macrospora]|uniref:Nucleolar protein 13 n=1 Tax=Linderina macrospora TaxID=4868 RepID=A0ACC1JG77_9FUNG|nr:Nucleolar protein 13 [Linderina macrospora]